MDIGHVKATIIEKLSEIQTDSGFPDTQLDGSVCPLDMEGFDSKIWPVAIGIVAESLHIDIPTDKNIFESADGKHTRLTVDQIAAAVCIFTAVGDTGA